MFRLLLIAVILTTFTAGLAQAQPPCTIGVYADEFGTQSTFSPTQMEYFNLYVVMFVEDVANAAAYSINVPGLFDPVNNPGGGIFLTSRLYGPNGSGLAIPPVLPEDPNETVGFGECAVGFGGTPIVVATYEFLIPGEDYFGGVVTVGPHETEFIDPTNALYSTCQDVVKECWVGNCLYLEPPVATQSVSFGQVKALF
jgi:hypothetical protein